jgi:hypothetical protein
MYFFYYVINYSLELEEYSDRKEGGREKKRKEKSMHVPCWSSSGSGCWSSLSQDEVGEAS